MKGKSNEELRAISENLRNEYAKVQEKMATLYQYMAKIASRYKEAQKEMAERGLSADNNEKTGK